MIDFEIGTWVAHPLKPEWGEGRVIDASDSGIRVDFRYVGIKILDSRYVKLHAVPAPKIDRPAIHAANASLHPEDQPRSLRSPEERARRLAMLGLPHIVPLIGYIDEVKASIKAKTGQVKDMPFFDPCDGGIDARALFLLQSPGPKSSSDGSGRGGSGFISRNNDDPTAQHMIELMQNSGIARKDTLLWNAVPWYLGDDKKDAPIAPADFALAMRYLPNLLATMSNLQIVVLVGKEAWKASYAIDDTGTWPQIKTYHMSARVWHRQEMRERIERDFAAVGRFLTG